MSGRSDHWLISIHDYNNSMTTKELLTSKKKLLKTIDVGNRYKKLSHWTSSGDQLNPLLRIWEEGEDHQDPHGSSEGVTSFSSWDGGTLQTKQLFPRFLTRQSFTGQWERRRHCWRNLVGTSKRLQGQLEGVSLVWWDQNGVFGTSD